MDTPPGICVLDLDHSLPMLAEQLSFPTERLDLTALPSCRKMCSRSTFELLRAPLQTRQFKQATMIGSDDYHHLTYALLLTLQQPFSLVLFDNHSDFMPTPLGEDVISCGSWVADVLQMPLARQVVIAGAALDTMTAIPESDWDRVVYLPHEDPDASLLQPLPPAQQQWLTRVPSIQSVGVQAALDAALAQMDRGDVYISVDKDVLSPEHASVTWSQGTMTLDQLVAALEWVRDHSTVVGLDLCGDEPISPLACARGEAAALLQQSAVVNEAILRAILGSARR